MKFYCTVILKLETVQGSTGVPLQCLSRTVRHNSWPHMVQNFKMQKDTITISHNISTYKVSILCIYYISITVYKYASMTFYDSEYGNALATMQRLVAVLNRPRTGSMFSGVMT